MRGGVWASGYFCACAALLASWPAEAGSKAKPQISAETVAQALENHTGNVQLVTFPDTSWRAVKIVRGNSPVRDKTEQPLAAEKAEIAEIVTFAEPQGSVRILRGDSVYGFEMPRRDPSTMTTQVVSFADLQDQPITILRGPRFQAADIDLFNPASITDLDRIAFAVDGAESSHGADLRMWREERSGPQGPMQVTAAAAFDVGGGDRFDLTQNRALGRAYLAHMYRRYGNWPDAVAAYNWGPGNMDAWIGGGRAVDKFPLEVERYRDRVLREAAFAPGSKKASGWPLSDGPPPVRADSASAEPPTAKASAN
jgi:transglycosylase-like protein with SLT domain